MNKIKLSLVASLLTIVISTQAQQWLKLLPKNKTKQELTLKDYKQAFDDYWEPFNVRDGYYYENGVKKKAYGRKQFMRWYYNMRYQVDAKTEAFPKQTAMDVYLKHKQMHSTNSSDYQAAWVNLGASTSQGGYYGVGRIDAIAFHPTDNNTYWVGSPTGGLWVTHDNGNSWTCLTDNNQILGISDIIIPSDYETSQTIYIATGDRDSFQNQSIGVLKSTDGGATWNTTGLQFTLDQYKMTNRLLLDPNDNQTLLAATTGGLYKTTNGGDDWELLSPIAFRDIKYKPDDFSILYGSFFGYGGTIFRSSDSGNSWTAVFNENGELDINRVELAITPDNPNLVLALAYSDSGSELHGIYRSEDAGNSFSTLYNYSGLIGHQGWYDLSIAISPKDQNVIFVGGINTYKSSDGGASWDLSNHWWGTTESNTQPVHADKHILKYRSNGDLFEGNDGGIYMSINDGDFWIDKSNDLSIAQIYKLNSSAQDPSKIITGLQDNCTKLLENGNWRHVKAGDGMECIIDYTNSDIQYACSQWGNLEKTTNNWMGSGTSISPPGSGGWVTPYVMSPSNHNTLYIGYDDVWKTTNQGEDWTQLSSFSDNDKISTLAIATSNEAVLYVSDDSNLWKTTDGGATWTELTTPWENSYITNIAIKNDDANHLWLTLSGYNSENVFESTDGGTTWTDVSEGLPEIPVYTIVQDKQVTGEVHLYAGTELGVYFKKGSENWQEYNEGLPKVKCMELEIYYDNTPSLSRLRLASYGRGLWETPLADNNLPVVNTSDVGDITSNSAICGGELITDGGEIITAQGIVWGTNQNPTLSDNVITSSETELGSFSVTLNNLSSSTIYYARAYASNNNGTVYGNLVSFNTLCGSSASYPYEQNFEEETFPPECWTTYRGANNAGETYDWERSFGYNEGGYFSARIIDAGYQYNEDWLVSRSFTLPNSTSVYLSFDERLENTPHYWDVSPLFQVKVSTSSQIDRNSFTNVASYGLNDFTTDYSQRIIDLSAYAGQTIYIAFVLKSNWGYLYYSGNSWYIDNIKIDPLGLPLVTTSGNTSTITDNTINLNGEVLLDGGTPVISRGFVWDTNPEPTLSDNVITDAESEIGNFDAVINNLAPSTTYYIRAYASNANGTDYGNEISFETPTTCEPITSYPYLEDFQTLGNNQYFPPDCWSLFKTESIYPWERKHSGNNYFTEVKFFSNPYEDRENWLITKGFTLPVTTSISLKFNERHPYCYPPGLSIKLSTSSPTDTSSFVDIFTYETADCSNSFESVREIDLSAYMGQTVYIAFVGKALSESSSLIWWDIDNVKIEPADIPIIVTSNVTSITTNSAVGGAYITFEGTNPISSQGLVWDTNPQPNLSSNLASVSQTDSDTLTAVMNDLSPNTMYYVRAYAITANDTAYGNEVTFSTLCESVVEEIPYEQNFEGNIFPPSCWTSFRGTNNLGDTYDWAKGMDSLNTSNIAYIQSESVSGGNTEDWLVTEAFSLPSTTSIFLSFDERQIYDDNYHASYAIKISTTSQSEMSTFTDILSYQETDFTTSYSTRSIDLSAYAGQTIYLAFVKLGGSGDAWAIDNVKIYTLPVANFSATPLVICEGSSVNFTDLSLNNPTAWTWDFGDGTPPATSQNPSHIYNNPGTYTISLTVSKTEGIDSTKMDNYITVMAHSDAGTDGTLEICEGTIPTEEELFAALGGTPQTGGVWTNDGLVYTYTVAGTAPCGDATATVTLTEVAPSNAGTSGTLQVCEGTTPTEEELFTALGGAPDTGGVWTNEDLIYTYTVTNTICGDVTATVTLTETPNPNAGTDGTLTICEGTTPNETDLFAALGGPPQTGGTWSNNGLVYTYTVDATAPCTGSATATITLTEAPNPNAGTDGTLTICEGTSPNETELFTALGGNPQTGGTWSNNGLVYTYTVDATAPCTGSATATITLTEAPNPNAGTDGTLTICEGTSPNETELFTALGGNPQTGGTWSNDDLVYTYTVIGTAPCGDATATVSITETPAPNAGTDGTLTICEGTTPNETDLFAALGGNPQTGGTWSNDGLVYTYTVNATAPCTGSATASVTVTENPIPNAGFTMNTASEPTIILTNTSTNADSYIWNLGDGTSATTNDVEHTYTANGDYTINLEATNDCGTSNHEETLTITNVGIISLSKANIKLYPNPASDYVKIDLGSKFNEVSSISIVDNLGKKLVVINKIEKQMIALSTKDLVSGVYFVNILTNDRNIILELSIIK